ncbi:MAG: spore cortex biosynthesis protein YabQ [Clostridia bacterium]|nr:spore cortex biosynthesis protein YabQ [Clostridia bacterium]
MFSSLAGGGLFLQFFLLGVFCGLGYECCKILKLLFKNNIIITNAANFVYFCVCGICFCGFLLKLAGGIVYFYLIVAMVLGIVIEQISIGFFFTKFYFLVYNVFTKMFARIKKTKFGKHLLR